MNDATTRGALTLKTTWLTLFASTGTLICCALPIIFVFPLLITLSLHKVWVFSFSGAMLALSGWLMYRPGRACPTTPELGQLCNATQTWNQRLYGSSVVIWCIGFFAAFLALPLRIWLGL
jgi:hypothetical protein